jgi:maltose alpha-D-glucosyltransferase / alpha-amylase
LILVEVEYADQSTETYSLPLRVDGDLRDALEDHDFRSALFQLMSGGETRTGEHGGIIGQPGPGLGEIKESPPSRAHAVEQSNSSIIYGDHIFLKLYRRLEHGMNPDAEILRFLSSRGFAHTPPFAGSIEYRDAHGHACVLALATGLVRNNGDAWSFTLGELKRWFDALLAGDEPGAAVIEAETLTRVAQLGARTGELHLALATETAEPDFAAEPLSPPDFSALTESILASAKQVLRLITTRLATLPSPARELAKGFAALEPALLARARFLTTPLTAAKTRTHGDYHLGQVLETGGDFVIIDFEGEPLRSLATRREKRSPFRDVAGMLRSFDYAAHAALEAHATLSAQAARWSAKAQRTFLEAWLATTNGAVFRAAARADEDRLLDAFLLEKALYEVVYEINNRPTWLPIPLRGVLRLLEGAV